MATTELESILERLGLNRYLENCRRECIDDACLDTLEPDDVRELGFPIFAPICISVVDVTVAIVIGKNTFSIFTLPLPNITTSSK